MRDLSEEVRGTFPPENGFCSYSLHDLNDFLNSSFFSLSPNISCEGSHQENEFLETEVWWGLKQRRDEKDRVEGVPSEGSGG